MRTIKPVTILLAILFATASCFTNKKAPSASYNISSLSDTSQFRDGTIVYTLPRTVFTVFVEAERVIEIPGPYARYADDLLGLRSVITDESEHWSVTGISVSSHEEADPSEYYLIEATGLLKTNVFSLKKEGLILDLNPESNYIAPYPSDSRETNINRFRTVDLGSDEYYRTQTDTAFRRVQIDSSFIRIPYIVEKKRKLSEDQLAERAARRLTELREGKVLILTGEANVFPQNEAAINELNRLEKEYTELFTGKTIIETRRFTYQFIPGGESIIKPFPLLKFSEVTGPGDASSSGGGQVITLELLPENKTKDLTVITRSSGNPAAPGNDKIFYRIPDIASLNIKMGKETLYSSRKMVYQLGEIIQLPSNFIISK